MCFFQYQDCVWKFRSPFLPSESEADEKDGQMNGSDDKCLGGDTQLLGGTLDNGGREGVSPRPTQQEQRDKQVFQDWWVEDLRGRGGHVVRSGSE